MNYHDRKSNYPYGVRAAAFLLSACLAIPGGLYSAHAEEPESLPQPYYDFTFDGTVENNQVENEGTKTGITGTIVGDGEGLGVVYDAVRDSNVLNLPGGSLTSGSLQLPEEMFGEVTEAGFTFSFWINVDESAGHYNRVFSASSIPLNSDNGNNGAWNAPEFTFVAGGEDYSQWAYNTSVMLSDRKSQMKLIWNDSLERGRWQHVAISVSPTAYNVYLDGEKVGTTDKNGNQNEILAKFFDELTTYKYNAIGKSVYSTDNDLKAKIDEFRYYNEMLSDAQVKAVYESYAVDTSALSAKIAELEALSISFYTKASYEALQSKIAEAEAVVINPVSAANVTRMLNELDAAKNALQYYDGVTAETTFTNAQLQAEIPGAEELSRSGALTEESQMALDAAIDAANSVVEQGETAGQEAVDNVLVALRTAVEEADFGATLRFDAAENTGDMFHGSTGFLYGVSEVNVPSFDLIQAIQPKILVQKAADGQQHPSGDGYRLTDYLTDCGVENIQIYLQDYYLEWPYENQGIEDYQEKVQSVVSKMVEGKTDEELSHYSFVLFNEPDNIWYGSDINRLCNDWKTIYDTVKQINASLKVAGPNFATYKSGNYRTFLEFCQKNNCLPEYITWHELQKDKLTSFKSHCDEVKGYIETYYKDSGIEPIIFVNETVNFDDVGTPGQLVNWISIFEEEKVYASIPYWGLANSLNELAADSNKPNGAWWIYKWYAQMTGHTISLTLENIDNPSAYGRLYGLTSVDDDSSTVYTLFGGQAGSQTICIDNIKETATFQNADSAHVKIYRTKYTGHQGFADDIPVVFEGDVDFVGDSLVYTMDDAELMDAYFAVVTPATGKDSTQYEIGTWQETYEAEDAAMIGEAQVYYKTGGSDLARSNRAEVGHLNTENDGVEFTVNVPEDGEYRLNIYYSSQAPQVDPLTLEYVDKDGQNRAIGAIVQHTLSVDGTEWGKVSYDSTVKWGYYNYTTVYLDLTQGQHIIKLMHAGENQNGKDEKSMLCALLDKIDLTLVTEDSGTIVVEPEELVGTQTGFTFTQPAGGYTGAGSAQGSGDFRFYVCAPQDGYYIMAVKGSGTASLSKSVFQYGEDATADAAVGVEWNELLTVTLGSDIAEKIYLTAGMNELRLNGTDLVLDQILFTEDADTTAAQSITVEAESCTLSGTDTNDGYNYLRGSTATPTVVSSDTASGGQAVEGFRGGQDNVLTLKVNVEEAGDYKLSICYSNNEPAPVMKTQAGADYVHPYNTDLVERYAQIAVNGGTPQTVYFRNTLCWDVYRNVVVDVTLEAGENAITFTNDNSYKFSSVQDDFTPRFDKFVLAPAVVSALDAGESSGSTGSGSSSNKTETTTNPDGSTTTTVTKPDGSKTETTKAPDGSSSVVTTDKNGQVEATVTVSNSAVESAKGAVALPMPGVTAATNAAKAPTVTVDLPTDITAKVEIPVDNITVGTVAVIVREDGTEEIIKTSVATDNGVAVELKDGDTVKIVDNSKDFSDVPDNFWGADAVEFSTSREIFNGTSATNFSPNANMNRAMIVTVLARLENVDTTVGSNWYETGRQWAMEQGISDGTNMMGTLTREQLTAMLYRYVGSPTVSGGITGFVDANNVSSWAADAMTWAVQNGIISGSNGKLSPQGDATRAEVATMLMRFIEKMA